MLKTIPEWNLDNLFRVHVRKLTGFDCKDKIVQFNYGSYSNLDKLVECLYANCLSTNSANRRSLCDFFCYFSQPLAVVYDFETNENLPLNVSVGLFKLNAGVWKEIWYFYTVEFENNIPSLYIYHSSTIHKIENARKDLDIMENLKYDNVPLEYSSKIWSRHKVTRFFSAFTSTSPVFDKEFSTYIQEFVSMTTSNNNNVLPLTELTGDEILEAYKNKTYGGSCMCYEDTYRFTEIYAINDNVRMLAFKIDGKNYGRVLVFNNDDYYFVSRFYVTGKYTATYFRDAVKAYMSEHYPDLKYARMCGTFPTDVDKNKTWVTLDIPDSKMLPYFDSIENGWVNSSEDVLKINPFDEHRSPQRTKWRQIFLQSDRGGELYNEREADGMLNCYYTGDLVHEDEAYLVLTGRHSSVYAHPDVHGEYFTYCDDIGEYVDIDYCFYCELCEEYYCDWNSTSVEAHAKNGSTYTVCLEECLDREFIKLDNDGSYYVI